MSKKPHDEILFSIKMIEVFDLLNDVKELEEFLATISSWEREMLYKHPLLKEFDLLP